MCRAVAHGDSGDLRVNDENIDIICSRIILEKLVKLWKQALFVSRQCRHPLDPQMIIYHYSTIISQSNLSHFITDGAPSNMLEVQIVGVISRVVCVVSCSCASSANVWTGQCHNGFIAGMHRIAGSGSSGKLPDSEPDSLLIYCVFCNVSFLLSLYFNIEHTVHT